MTDLSSQLNPSGCNTSSAKDGSCFAREKGDLCPLCSAKRLATAKALYEEKKKTLEFLNGVYGERISDEEKINKKIEELKSEIKQIEQEVPEVLDK